MPIVSGGGGAALPSQWTANPTTGGVTIRTAGATHRNDYGTVLDIYNADGDNIAFLDSAGEFNAYLATSGVSGGFFAAPVGVSLTSGDAILVAQNDRSASLSAWYVDGLGHEVIAARAAPADSDLAANLVSAWYDATNGAAKFVRRGKTANGTVVQNIAWMAPPITSGALPTATLVSGTGAQIALNRDARTVTPVTFNPTGAATATCVVALSPDNVTYSTLVTKTFPISVALAGSIDEVAVIVPAGWYLKLTTTNATLGTTTYY